MQLNAGGYGYGLRISQTCSFRHIVAHSGGLPGFGSLMRWLPEYGVGFIAFGNLTYTGWGRVVDAARSTLLAKTGGLQPRIAAAVAGADRRARRGVGARRAAGTTRLADAIAAENLFLDQSEGAAARRDRGAAREGRRVHAPARRSTRSRTRCAASGR